MAIQVLDTRKPLSPGQQISKGLVSGLGGYLEKLSESKLKEIERQRVAQGLQGIGFEPEEAKGISNLPLDLQKEVIKDQYTTQRAGLKESKKLVHDTLAAERSARDNVTRLDRIEQLEKTGRIQGVSGQLLKKVGLGQFRTAETQELEKLSTDFLRDVKAIFGARPAVYEVQTYMNALPTLLQSPEGRQRVVRNLRLFNEATLLRGQTMKDILKENKGRPPADLELQVEERIGPELDRLSRDLILGVEGSAQQAQQGMNELPDAAQYPGKKIRDSQTGQILQSNGRQWLPIGG